MPRLFMLWIVLPPVLLYLGLCGFLYARQRSLIYYPQFTTVDADQTDFELARDGVTLRGWVLNPGQPRALLYFGGNAESVQYNRDDFARWFPRHSVYLLAYRGYGASGGVPTERALVGDAQALYDRVRDRHPAGIDVIGRSLGSGVASRLAVERPVRRLALVTPFDSMASLIQAHYPWLPARWLTRDRFDSARHLSGYRGPLLVVRAGRDQVVPPRNTQRLIAALPQPPRVVDMPQADHITVSESPAYARALTAFFAEP